MKRLLFTVTNDLNYDQRMIRICTSLVEAGYDVMLIGREMKNSLLLVAQPFLQKRLFCFFSKGKLFYIEYNIRLFFYLLFKKHDLVCAIDLDSILPCLIVSRLKNKKRVYDAHELFCEMKEIVNRPFIHKAWNFIERHTVPRFKNGYTVNEPIRKILQDKYGVQYQVIRNVSLLREELPASGEHFIIYQGAVNHGRSFETLIPAFQWIDCPLWIYGDGNFMDEAKALIEECGLQNKVLMKGKAMPAALSSITASAVMGITLFENNGLSNYYSLANRFFDYIHAGIPQLCVDYPAYREINKEYNVAVLIDDLSSASIAQKINTLLKDEPGQQAMRQNCQRARLQLNWQAEEKKLVAFYAKLFAT